MDESNVSFSDQDGGSITNCSGDIVLRRLPSKFELVALFREFDRTFRENLFALFSMKCSEVDRRFGNLGLARWKSDVRSDRLFGLLRESAGRFMMNMANGPLIAALDDMNARGQPRRRMPSQGPTAAQLVERKSYDEQVELVRRLVGGDLDSLLRLDQASLLGWKSLEARVNGSKDVSLFLKHLADEVDQFVNFSRHGLASKAKGAGRIWAPAWFALFLARKGVWLFPHVYVGRMRWFYPRRLRPMLAWMSVSKECFDLFDLAFAMELDRKKTTLTYGVSVLVVAALSSNMFETRRFCSNPLERMKKAVVPELDEKRLNQNLSSSINAIYRMLASEFEIDLEDRPEAPLFLLKKRLNSRGVSPLNWCFEPNKKNTRLASAVIGRPITSVPEFVKDVAREMVAILKHYEHQDTQGAENCMGAWCLFLMSLPEKDAPRSLSQIDRRKHVNSLSEHDNTFANFLPDKFGQRNVEIARRSISIMQRAWRFSAELNGFGSQLTNPFDVRLDTKIKDKPRPAKSKHKYIKDSIYNIVFEKNLEDNYAFARSLPESWYQMRVPGSDRFENVFFAACPLIIEIIAATGMRGKSARYLDSGEGDERCYDAGLERMTANAREITTPGRQAGFIQTILIGDGGEQKEVPTINVESAKTGGYSVAYCDPDLARRFTEFVALQEKYNPVLRSIKAADARNVSPNSDNTRTASVFPAFRMPGSKTVVSSEKVRGYFVKLLRECEPLVERELGYHVPLVVNGVAQIKLHDLRVTKNVRTRDRGGSREDARVVLGHQSIVMADYYYNPPIERTYHALANAAALDKQIMDASTGDKEALAAFAAEQEIVHGGITKASRAIRHAADDFARSRVEFLDHGICTGLCSTGGPIVNRRPTPVWREMACASCSHRASGPRYLKGLATRVNVLSWELREVTNQIADLSRSRDEAREKGKPTASFDVAIERKKALRQRITSEQQQEILNIKKYELAAVHLDNSDAIFGPASGKFDGDRVAFREVHEFELLQALVADLDMRPSLTIEFSPSIELEWGRILHRVVRANSLEDVLYTVHVSERRALLSVGQAIVESSNSPTEIQALIDHSFASATSGPLQDWRAKIEQRLLLMSGDTSNG